MLHVVDENDTEENESNLHVREPLETFGDRERCSVSVATEIFNNVDEDVRNNIT